MSTVQTIRAKSATSPHKARATASRKDDDADDVALASDDAVEDEGPTPVPPPPGLGKLVDKTV